MKARKKSKNMLPVYIVKENNKVKYNVVVMNNDITNKAKILVNCLFILNYIVKGQYPLLY